MSNREEPGSSGITGRIIDSVLDRFMDKYGISQEHIDKAKALLDQVQIKDRGDYTEVTIRIKK